MRNQFFKVFTTIIDIQLTEDHGCKYCKDAYHITFSSSLISRKYLVKFLGGRIVTGMNKVLNVHVIELEENILGSQMHGEISDGLNFCIPTIKALHLINTDYLRKTKMTVLYMYCIVFIF